MSNFYAKIIDIQNETSLNIVTFQTQETILKMISLELNEEIRVGTNVLLSCKATNVALAKKLHGELSYSNQIPMQIESMEAGKLLSSLNLRQGNLKLESIITTASLQRMQLKVGERVTALIKSSDLSIMEIQSV